jgi:hypothetical protein
MSDGHQPDKQEKRIRFGCGFIFIGLLAFFKLARHAYTFDDLFRPFALAIGAGAIGGFFAMRQGDDFWHKISNWFHSRQ